MKKMTCLAGMAAILLMMTGCMHLEYTGQSFPKLGVGTPVAFYNADEPVPEGKYHAIGRAVLTAPEDSEQRILRKKLIECALEKGADAVKVKEFNRVVIGMQQNNGKLTGPEDGWRNDGRNLGGDYIYSNSFGEKVVQSQPKPVYEIQIKALYLVSNERFAEVTKEYHKEIRSLDKIAEEQAQAPVTAATLEEMLKKQPPVTPMVPETAKPEPKPEKKPIELELKNNSPVAF